jgi:hypothetical protein
MLCPEIWHLVASLGGARSTPLEERCTISYEGLDQLRQAYKESKGKSMSEKLEYKQRCLVSHINAMSLFATTIPIKQLSLVNSLDAESPYFDLLLDMEELGDYFGSKPSLLYPAVITNENGLTCYDVIRAGANWKVDPGYNAIFGGLVLDKKSAVSA